MITILAFTVAGARLGVEVAHVEAVLPNARLEVPPELPPLLRGFLNHGGRMVPAIRLERLLRLDLSKVDWNPEQNLSSRLVVVRAGGQLICWMIDADSVVTNHLRSELVVLPPGHVLNRCAERVVPRTPPQPSIVVLEPSRLLLEAEKIRLAELAGREQSRLAEL